LNLPNLLSGLSLILDLSDLSKALDLKLTIVLLVLLFVIESVFDLSEALFHVLD
jgi:hypothetical protein